MIWLFAFFSMICIFLMARQNNARNLRTLMWTNPSFCMFTNDKRSMDSVFSVYQNTQTISSFLKKIQVKTKKKKTNSLLK
jgi:hypothetical protein